MLALLLGLLLFALVAAYLFYKQGRLAKDIRELQASADSYVTLDDWESSLAPRLTANEERQQAMRRQLSMIAASVRSLQSATGAAEDPYSPPLHAEELEGQFDEDDEEEAREVLAADEAATGAAHAEDQLQAVLSSVANMLGMGARTASRGAPSAAAASRGFAASASSGGGGPALQTIPTTHLFLSRLQPSGASAPEPRQSLRGASGPLIEEEEEDVANEAEELAMTAS